MISLRKYSYKFILIHSTIKSHNWGNKATSATISHMIQLRLFLFRPSFCCFFPWFETSVRFLSAVVLFMVLPAGTVFLIVAAAFPVFRFPFGFRFAPAFRPVFIFRPVFRFWPAFVFRPIFVLRFTLPPRCAALSTVCPYCRIISRTFAEACL